MMQTELSGQLLALKRLQGGLQLQLRETGPNDYTLYWVDAQGRGNIAHEDSNLRRATYVWATTCRELELPEKCSQCEHRRRVKCTLTNKATQDWDYCEQFSQIDWPRVFEVAELEQQYL